MGNIERWEIHVCKDCRQTAHGPGQRCGRDRRRTWTEMELVEVVPAEQLEEAVDLLHELADAVAENQASPDVRYSHRVREALEAIDAAGYRPSTRGQ